MSKNSSLVNIPFSTSNLLNLIKGAIFTGLRKGDLFNLKWSDVNLERGFLNYREQKKRDKLGFKYLNGDMISLLMEIHRGKVIISFWDRMGTH